MTKKEAERRKRILKNDTVRIVVPEFFVRCGYPKSLDSETAVVMEKFGAEIRKMICDPSEARLRLGKDPGYYMLKKVSRELAYARLRTNGFGGVKRIIYTKRMDELKGEEFKVSEVKFHKTGIYCAPYGSYEDYEPGFLDHSKTHKILVLVPNGVHIYNQGYPAIEATNVEKIMDTRQ